MKKHHALVIGLFGALFVVACILGRGLIGPLPGQGLVAGIAMVAYQLSAIALGVLVMSIVLSMIAQSPNCIFRSARTIGRLLIVSIKGVVWLLDYRNWSSVTRFVREMTTVRDRDKLSPELG